LILLIKEAQEVIPSPRLKGHKNGIVCYIKLVVKSVATWSKFLPDVEE